MRVTGGKRGRHAGVGGVGRGRTARPGQRRRLPRSGRLRRGRVVGSQAGCSPTRRPQWGDAGACWSRLRAWLAARRDGTLRPLLVLRDPRRWPTDRSQTWTSTRPSPPRPPPLTGARPPCTGTIPGSDLGQVTASPAQASVSSSGGYEACVRASKAFGQSPPKDALAVCKIPVVFPTTASHSETNLILPPPARKSVKNCSPNGIIER